MAINESRPPLIGTNTSKYLFHISYHCSELPWDHNLRKWCHIVYSQYPLGFYIATYRDFAAARSSNINQINDSLIFEYFGIMREKTAILISHKSVVSSILFHLRKILLWQKPQISSITSDDSERCSSNYHGSDSISISWYTIMSAKRLA